MFLVGLCLSLIWWTQGLVIDTKLEDGSESAEGFPLEFYHVRSAFSNPGVYASGPLVLAQPIDLCYIDNSLPFTCNGSIVLILRGGNCTFYLKTENAALLGAAGVVIANNQIEDPDRIVVMGSPNGMSDDLGIPSVSITYYTFLKLISLMPVMNVSHDSMSVLSNDKPEQTAATTLYAFIDGRGEVQVEEPTSPYNGPLKLLGVMLLVFPAGWLVFVAILWFRKCFQNRRNAMLRTRLMRSIPIINYSPTYKIAADSTESKHGAVDTASVAGSSSTGNNNSTGVNSIRIHNEACAICLDDFAEGAPVKLLPCHHGYHIHCIDPWLQGHSDLCPICKTSIIVNETSLCSDCCAFFSLSSDLSRDAQRLCSALSGGSAGAPVAGNGPCCLSNIRCLGCCAVTNRAHPDGFVRVPEGERSRNGSLVGVSVVSGTSGSDSTSPAPASPSSSSPLVPLSTVYLSPSTQRRSPEMADDSLAVPLRAS
jgi:hypothetical protein